VQRLLFFRTSAAPAKNGTAVQGHPGQSRAPAGSARPALLVNMRPLHKRAAAHRGAAALQFTLWEWGISGTALHKRSL